MKNIMDKICIFLFICVISLTIAVASSTYSADSIILSDNSALQNAIEDLYSKKTDCPAGYKCFLNHNIPQVGDYVQITPSLTSFTTDKTKTGYSIAQTIYPSRLTLWRVIRINSDGTMEIISTNSSSEKVTFYGKTGYMNYIGYLNLLASKYENSKYTVGSRHMGYSNQTEYITDTSKLTQTSVPWSCDTGASCHPENQENLGGGDSGYNTDIQLVTSVFKTLTTGSGAYYLASRYYDYSSSSSWKFRIRTVSEGAVGNTYTYYYSSSKFRETSSTSLTLRPILILKAGISYTPSLGTETSPFILG